MRVGPAFTRWEHRYGLVLLLILCSLVFQLAASDQDWARLVDDRAPGGNPGPRPVCVGGSAADRAARHGRRRARGARLGRGPDRTRRAGDHRGRIVTVLLVALAPSRSSGESSRGSRTKARVTMHTMFGVLCIYLLLGCCSRSSTGWSATPSRTAFFASGIDADDLRLPVLQLRDPDHGRLRGPGGGHRPGALGRDRRGADRPDLPGHGRGGDRRRPRAAAAPERRAAGILCLMAADASRLRIGLAQVNPTVGDIEGNARLIAAWIARARDAGAQMVVFPEQTITGYPAEDLWLKPHFLDAARRALEEIASGVEGDRGPGRLPGARCGHLQLGRGARRRAGPRHLPQGPAPQLQRLRRAPLLRARRHPGA